MLASAYTLSSRVMNIFFRFLNICLFRAGPEDIPASIRLMQIVSLAYILLGIVINLLDADLFTSVLVSLADIVILFGFAVILLHFQRKLPRFRQTVMAVMGTSSLLGLLVLPFLALFYQYDDTTQAAGWLLFALMLIMLWSLMVTSHIFRRALNCSAPFAVGWTVLYVAVSVIGSGLVMSAIA